MNHQEQHTSHPKTIQKVVLQHPHIITSIHHIEQIQQYIMSNSNTKKPLVGVLAIQGAFEEHQTLLEASGCRTKQVSSRVELVMSVDPSCMIFHEYIYNYLFIS